MSYISKSSSRSSSLSSGFSSLNHEQFPTSFNLQTILHVEQNDLNIREIFCGEQDCRLNELRQMTGAIIDLHVVPGTKRPFERVDWTVSHRNSDICDFVLRRLNYWMQETQLVCDMALEDVIFLEKYPQKSTRKHQLPPISMPKFTNRQRTRSLTESEETSCKIVNAPIPATPMTFAFKRETEPLKLNNQDVSAFKNRFGTVRSNENCKREKVESIDPSSLEDLIDSARWAGLLSDSSDNELNDGRVCFADTVALSKLAECLRQNGFETTSSPEEIEKILRENSIKLTNREDRRRMSNQDFIFHRLILDGHIQFPLGISKDSKQAKKLAYRQMIDVCLHPHGVQMKPLVGNRVKVVKRDFVQQHNDTTTDQFDVNATYLTTADFSTLSAFKELY